MRVADGALHSTSEPFEPPTDKVIVPLPDVPALDETFVKQCKNFKFMHRDDDDEWMLGSVKKHKSTARTDANGNPKRAKIEFQFKNATQKAYFRLRMSEYGSDGQWALLKDKENAAATTQEKKKAP